MIFSHDGDYGDTIAALALMRDMGGGDLVLFPTNTREPYTPQHIAGIAPLLEKQHYIQSVRYGDRPGNPGINLGAWRFNYRNGLNLCDMYFSWINKPHIDRDQPWLWAEPNPIADVIFARTSRYHGEFPWARAVRKYGDHGVFLGHPHEHADFCREFGEVAFHPTENLWEVARILAGAKLLCVNQTSIFWINEGIKRPVCLEASPPPHNNCHFDRTASMYITSKVAELPDMDLLDERLAYLCAERDQDRSLLTKEKRLQLARAALSCQNLPGDAAELGVYRGGSAAIIAAALPGKKVHLFDTFAGQPADDIYPEGHHQGDFDVSVEEVKQFLAGYSVVFHPGVFQKTATAHEGQFCFVHVDGDLYQTTLEALEFFWPRLVSGGMMVFDDFGWQHCPGVVHALREKNLLSLVCQTPGEFQAVLRKP